MKRVCTICARGGSQGVKNKNIKDFCGIPLIAHSLRQARLSGLFDVIAVSSDSDAILAVSLAWGADYVIKRPDEMATAEAGKLPVIQHAFLETEKLSGLKFETVVDIDATAPLRTIEDIQRCIELFQKDEHSENLVTAAPARKSPYFNMLEYKEDGFVTFVKKPDANIVRRQDSPACFDMNASIYVWSRDSLLASKAVITEKTQLFVMPEERSIDIDTPFDWQVAELIASQREDLNEHLSETV